MSETQTNGFLVIGGGIGGLSTALALARSGHEVWVFERAEEFREIGAGLQLGPNAVRVLDWLGVYDALCEVAFFPHRLVALDAIAERELGALDLGESFRAHFGYPYLVIHRSDLLDVLLHACRESGRVHLLANHLVSTVENVTDGVRLACQNGSEFTGKAVIAADGLWSKTRALIQEDSPVCKGYVAYRGTLPTSQATEHPWLDDVVMWMGPGLHFVQYPIRRGELYNQVAVFESQKFLAGEAEWGTPDELFDHFQMCSTRVQDSLRYIHVDRHWIMYDRDPISNWTDGRITLLGDAAHPMYQYMAQGACQAIEDAACLALSLKAVDMDIEKAFAIYQQERIPRTARIQTSVRTWGDIIHTHDATAALLRNTIMSNRSPDDFQFVDWIYGYNALTSVAPVPPARVVG
ncbi:MAG: FAD-dependent monooxygenase [Alicyclobacillus herbarius]|uniref:FAD-dependent oxidoreductase n=1 Tax=Alicyclobacillus herbarius TaxID=122960 RepID=UPI0004796592|nr:FAD-dependent oxidoreductase [Alicyclobacillus herbarius]MCL6633873.1 FAD-dependent monooxygenase [Alicyclobacillus herbarius]